MKAANVEWAASSSTGLSICETLDSKINTASNSSSRTCLLSPTHCFESGLNAICCFRNNYIMLKHLCRHKQIVTKAREPVSSILLLGTTLSHFHPPQKLISVTSVLILPPYLLPSLTSSSFHRVFRLQRIHIFVCASVLHDHSKITSLTRNNVNNSTNDYYSCKLSWKSSVCACVYIYAWANLALWQTSKLYFLFVLLQ